ncbi:MAG TPA: hypothetical protein VGR95_15060 [Thermoanaerobaculia bacterium]|jgi:hypothetical protein|nr:hypothetical protein [Thermoanaerobaculia bacterium]
MKSWLFIVLAAASLASDARARDLDIGWIERLPRMDYVEKPADPRRDGWPAPGQIVTWRAHIRNWDGDAISGVPYEWRLDGNVVAAGTFSVSANGTATVDLPWQWEFTRHSLTFEIDPSGIVEESEKGNDSLSVFTDSISVGFYVEQKTYDFFHRNQATLGVGSNSFEDFAQRQIAFINTMYAQAITLEAPQGVLDRWRLDEIVVVPDKSLPLVAPPWAGDVNGEAIDLPNLADRSVDVIYGFPDSSPAYGDDTGQSQGQARFAVYDTNIRHELGHVRYLTDVYRYFIVNDGSTRFVDITQKGRPVAGTSLMPLEHTIQVYATIEQGLMNSAPGYLDRYSAGALNLIAGYRARGPFGNTKANDFLGAFQYDIPSGIRIRLVDPSGVPMAGANVSYYRAHYAYVPGEAQAGYHYYDSPDFQATADANGEVAFDGDPIVYPPDVQRIHYSNGLPVFLTGASIIRVQTGSDTHFVYLDLPAVNRAFWRGEKDAAHFELVVGAWPCATVPVLQTPASRAQVQAGGVSLSWSRTPGAAGYLVFASVDGGPDRVVTVTNEPSALVDFGSATNISWHVEAQFNQCIASDSAISTFQTYTPPPRHRAVR